MKRLILQMKRTNMRRALWSSK